MKTQEIIFVEEENYNTGEEYVSEETGLYYFKPYNASVLYISVVAADDKRVSLLPILFVDDYMLEDDNLSTIVEKVEEDFLSLQAEVEAEDSYISKEDISIFFTHNEDLTQLVSKIYPFAYSIYISTEDDTKGYVTVATPQKHSSQLMGVVLRNPMKVGKVSLPWNTSDKPEEMYMPIEEIYSAIYKHAHVFGTLISAWAEFQESEYFAAVLRDTCENYAR